MGESQDEPCIEVISGRSRGQVFVLEDVRSYVIGRLPGAEIHIADPGVSRRHVKLTRQSDGKVLAIDMRSTNGLIVNGERHERCELGEGDEISLGPDAVLRLNYRDPCELSEASRPRPMVPMIAPLPDLGQHPAEESTGVIPRHAVTPRLESKPKPKLEDLPLSARQLEVSQHVAKGMTNAEIAAQLGISPRTVTSHLDHIYGRLGIGSRAALTRWIVERGLAE